MPSKLLVLGLGNPLSGADGFGPAVIQRLRREGAGSKGVELADVHTDLLGHLDLLVGRDHVILVDAVADPVGGRVEVVEEARYSRWDDRCTGVHQLSAIGVVKLFRILHPEAATTRISVVGYFVREEEFAGSTNSEVVERASAAVRCLIGAGQTLRS